jgi:preprotein translocase subunit SecG
MYGFFLTILVLDGIFLSVVILLQAGKGGGLAAMGGGGGTMTEGVLGGRQATSFLTRATWVSGAAFMVLALLLAILSSRADRPDRSWKGSSSRPRPFRLRSSPGPSPSLAGRGAVPPSDGVESPGEG